MLNVPNHFLEASHPKLQLDSEVDDTTLVTTSVLVEISTNLNLEHVLYFYL